MSDQPRNDVFGYTRAKRLQSRLVLLASVSLIFLAGCNPGDAGPTGSAAQTSGATSPEAQRAALNPSLGDVWVVDAQAVFPDIEGFTGYAVARVIARLGNEAKLQFSDDNYWSAYRAGRQADAAITAGNDELFKGEGIWFNGEAMANMVRAGQFIWLSNDVQYAVRHAPAVNSKSFPFDFEGFDTTLTSERAASEAVDSEDLPDPRLRKVSYISDGMSLEAWYGLPEGDGPHPAMVYLHGGFSLSGGDFHDARPFLDAGFAILLPRLRGENGNPGHFELWRGEVRDAAAASRWLAGQPGIDATRVYAFGHSVGGGVAALLSLATDTPLQITAGSGGLYLPSTFDSWADILPFNGDDLSEQRARMLFGNQQQMQRKHLAYIGEDDYAYRKLRWARSARESSGGKLEALSVPGDHFTSLPVAVERFIDYVKGDISQEAESVVALAE